MRKAAKKSGPSIRATASSSRTPSRPGPVAKGAPAKPLPAGPAAPRSSSAKPAGPAKPAKSGSGKSGSAVAPAIPPILLEGDETASPPSGRAPTGGPGERYVLGPAATVSAQGESVASGISGAGDAREWTDLPESYGTQQLLLQARDPHWVYACWDLSKEQLRRYNGRSVDRHLILRVYREELAGEPHREIHVHPESRNWFAHVGVGGSRFVAELGYYLPKDQWVSISTSGATVTPPDAPSGDRTARFETLPVDLTFPQILRLVKGAMRVNVPLMDALRQQRTSGQPGLPDSGGGAGDRWSPEQDRALAGVVEVDARRRVWVGSMEITALVRRQFEQESALAARAAARPSLAGGVATAGSIGAVPASAAEPAGPWREGVGPEAAAVLSLPQFTAGSAEWSSLGLASSPGAAAATERGFWFNVQAELVVYGATEPGASVVLGGREIRLRPDGTFSTRFALPDGHHELPATALSADGADLRRVELKFARSTVSQGEVGAAPADPALPVPSADALR